MQTLNGMQTDHANTLNGMKKDHANIKCHADTNQANTLKGMQKADHANTLENCGFESHLSP